MARLRLLWLAIPPVLSGAWFAACQQDPPAPESIPAAVRRLSRDLGALRAEHDGLAARYAAIDGLEEALGTQSRTLEGLKEQLKNTTQSLADGVAELKRQLEGGRAAIALDLATADGLSSARLHYEPGFGYALALSSSGRQPSVELTARQDGGTLRFLDGIGGEVASIGTRNGAGHLELRNAAPGGGAGGPSVRLGALPQRGGALTLFSADGKPVVQLAALRQGYCSLVLGDSELLDPRRPAAQRRGIVLLVTPDGSSIIIDGEELGRR